MFTPEQKNLALVFARHLVAGDYGAAHALLSQRCQGDISATTLAADFTRMIDAEWGEVDPLELEESEDWPFIYVVLGGDTYSEAIFIHTWVTEDGQPKIDNFEFGRP